ncbi:MAG TPA: ComEC/Rec2 family competence protein [Anaerolineales bacterium]
MRFPNRLISLLCIVLLLTGCSALGSLQPTSGNLQVHFIYVGQGDSILIISPEGNTALIDAGNPASGSLEYLQSQGIMHLDFVIATHTHADHIGGLAEVLLNIPVDTVVTNGRPHTTQHYHNLMDAISATGAAHVEAERGDRFFMGSLVFDVLHPLNQNDDTVNLRINNDSIVVRLIYGETTFLFVGDAEKEAEEDMLAAGIQMKADFLKLGHHGSRSSTSPQFLAAVSPSVAVYSAGVNNDLGFPDAETLTALKAIGADVFGTDIYGTIIVAVDKHGYSITTQEGWDPSTPSSLLAPEPLGESLP